MAKALERLVLPKGVKVVSPDDVIRRIWSFVQQVPNLEAIVIIAPEHDLRALRARAPQDQPDSRTRDMLRAALHKFDAAAKVDDPFERIIQIEGMRQLSVRETIDRISALVDACPGLAAVALLAPTRNLDKLRRLRSRNLSEGAAREMIRHALLQFDTSGLPPPA